MGPTVDTQLVRPGFYPAGGGQFIVRIRPARQLGRLEITERGEIHARRVRALVANLPRQIAERECRTIARKTGWDEGCFAVEEVRGSRGPGNVVLIELESEHLTEVFTGFGQIGVRAEAVAMRVLDEARAYLAAGVPVGKYLADQLLLPLGIGAHLARGAASSARWPFRSTPRRTWRFYTASSNSMPTSNKPAGTILWCVSAKAPGQVSPARRVDIRLPCLYANNIWGPLTNRWCLRAGASGLPGGGKERLFHKTYLPCSAPPAVRVLRLLSTRDCRMVLAVCLLLALAVGLVFGQYSPSWLRQLR